MGNDVSGEVRDRGTVVQVHQVHGDILLHKGAARRGWITSARVRLVARVLIAVLLICGEQYALSVAADSAFLKGESLRPLGIDENAIAGLVADKMRLCAEEVVAVPVNCPQRHSAPITGTVAWGLVDDPRDRMRTIWHNGKLFVSGTAIMTLWFRGGAEFEVIPVYFTTDVQWRGRETSVEDVGQIERGYRGELTPKRGFELTSDAIKQAIRHTFTACMGENVSPMDGRCPHVSGAPFHRNVKWTLNGDPFSNLDIDHDAEFGFVRVTASYSMTAWSRNEEVLLDPPWPYLQSGTYVANLIRTPSGAAAVLNIAHRP